ncbi:MAG: glycosyltransferase [Candidatus Yanofskybacteria bacterium]|nr:glycosyltransferase [Candidatus Yanofskybacteria bacterium]
MIKKIIYTSRSRLEYSLNAVCIRGLMENGVGVVEFGLANGGVFDFFRFLVFYLRNRKDIDAVIVGYDSPSLVIFLRFFCRKKIIYNAVLSVYERLIVSRGLASRFSIKAFYYWLLDFVAVHFADLIFVESDSQADYFKKIFIIDGKKVFRSWIGVDEDKFFYDPAIPKFPTFTVLFRGALQPETGAEYLIQAAKLLENEDIKFIMQCGGQLLDRAREVIHEYRPKNLDLRTNYIQSDELCLLMQKCHLSIGQLSKHERLSRTIPHKAYEALAMRLPYLTAANSGILELLKSDETCITCEPANARSLADKILWAKNNPEELGRIAKGAYEFYISDLKSRVIAKKLLDNIQSLN